MTHPVPIENTNRYRTRLYSYRRSRLGTMEDSD
jgi:hypothetical protein